AGKVHGSIVRERAAVLRAIGRELTRRFHRSQDGAVRPGLTIDDGALVVTDNYLKARIAPGLPRNHPVHVALRVVGDAVLGEVVGGAPTAAPQPAAPATSFRLPR